MKAIFVVVTLIIITPEIFGGKTPSGLYQDDGKGHTILKQKFSKKDVREISYDILNIMGFAHRPHPHLVDTKSPASQFLLQVYNSMRNEIDVDLSNGENGRRQNWGGKTRQNLTWSEFNVDQDEVDAIKKADEIISFVNRGHKYSTLLQGIEEEKQFWFDISEVSSTEQVLGAELRLWKKTLSKERQDGDYSEESTENLKGPEVIRIAAKQVIPSKDKKSFELLELDEIVAAKWEQGWLRLNVSQAFKHWIRQPDSNLGIVLDIKAVESGASINLESAGIITEKESEEHQPFLVSFLKSLDGQKIRKGESKTSRKVNPRRIIRSTKPKRSGKKNKKGRQYDFTDSLDRPRSCQMGMLYVNFEDLGWKDWVIAPDGFIAYYCHGECSFPLTASMNATNHAIVSTLVHTYYPLEYPKPSCAPVKLGSISMLYYDDNSNVTVKKYKDMVIKSCGCK